MSTHSVAEAKKQLSKLIDRAIDVRGGRHHPAGRARRRAKARPPGAAPDYGGGYRVAVRKSRRRDDAQDRCRHARQRDARRRRKVSLYLDASVLVALFVIDPSSARAAAFLSAPSAISAPRSFRRPWHGVYGQAISREMRDSWHSCISTCGVAGSASRQEITGGDIASADRILRHLDVNLRTPDALHIAAAQRVAATLVTLDRGMAVAGRTLGTAVATP
jgi:uncharacterized protein